MLTPAAAVAIVSSLFITITDRIAAVQRLKADGLLEEKEMRAARQILQKQADDLHRRTQAD